MLNTKLSLISPGVLIPEKSIKIWTSDIWSKTLEKPELLNWLSLNLKKSQFFSVLYINNKKN